MSRTSRRITMSATATLLVLAAAVPPATSAEAQTTPDRTTGEIIVRTHFGPGAPADPAIQLFRDDDPTDLWPSSCAPAPDRPGYTACDDLTEGTYTFGLGAAPDGVVASPSCTWSGVSGEMHPVVLSTSETWEWSCDLFVALPGLIMNELTDQFPLPTISVAEAEATCSTLDVGDVSPWIWCGATSFGEWRIQPPIEAAADGWRANTRCRPIGTYRSSQVGAFAPDTSTLTNSADAPIWRCSLFYEREWLVWYIEAEPGSEQAAFARAPWRLIDATTGEDVSARCSEDDTLGTGYLVSYQCVVPAGRYTVEIEGFTPEQGVSACTNVTVPAGSFTSCSALEVVPVDPPAEEPLPNAPGVTLPTTGTSSTDGIALWAALALALGTALLAAARLDRRPATGRGGRARR